MTSTSSKVALSGSTCSSLLGKGVKPDPVLKKKRSPPSRGLASLTARFSYGNGDSSASVKQSQQGGRLGLRLMIPIS